MTNRVQSLRSATAGNRPAVGTQPPGTLYTNWADNAFGVINSSQTAVDLIAVRFFSTTANYNTGDFVMNGGQLYTAKATITPGAFTATQWNKVTLAGDLGTMATQNANAVAITGGTVDATTLGATTPAAGTFSTMTTSSAHITGGTIDGTVIGGTTPAVGHFTTLGATGTGTFTGTAPQITVTPSIATDAILYLQKSVSGHGNVIQTYTGGSARWSMQIGDTAAESGSNVGSNFVIYSCDDDGTTFHNALTINRNNQNVIIPTNLIAGLNTPSAAIITSTWNGSVTVNGGLFLNNTDTGAAGQNYEIFVRNGSVIGSIQGTSTATSYVTTSDRRIKTDLKPIEDATGMLSRLKVYDHAWVIDPKKRALGVVAQEAIEVMPQAVAPSDDGVSAKSADEGFRPWGVDYSQIVPLLIAALQEANARIAALEGAPGAEPPDAAPLRKKK